MSAITQSYKIDMTSGAVPLRIKVSQYDAGIRQLTFWLYNLGTKLTSSQLSSLTAYVQGTKEDQKGFEYECTAGFSSEGCYVDVDITEQMTACAGDVVCELVLTAEDVRIGSTNFVLEVEKAALGADTDISETELPDIIDAGRRYAEQAEDAAERAEEAAAGVDNYALAGAGKMTGYSDGVINTNVYLHREPKVGDRLLIRMTQTFTDSTPIKIYKESGGTAYTLSFDMWSDQYKLEGLCLVEIVEFLQNLALRFLYSFNGASLSAGQYISITGGSYINNTAPQLGDNSEYIEITNADDGDLGAWNYYARYALVNFKVNAAPYSTTGEYVIKLARGSVLEDASLVDRDGNDYTKPIKAGTVLLCVINAGTDTVTVVNDDIIANGRVLDGNGNDLQSVAALEASASGNPIIVNAQGIDAKALTVELEPIQDLHGQSAPYVGGAGKNKLDTTIAKIKSLNTDGTWSGNAYTWKDITYTILTDNADNVIGFDVNGTASGRGWLYLSDTNYGENNAFFSNVTANGYIYTCDNATVDADHKFVFYNANTHMSYLLIDTNITVSHEKFYPMIRLSSVTDATFAPYSNICPISGRTETSVLDHGKNFIDIDNAINFEKYSGGIRNGFEFSNCKGTYTISQSVTTNNVYFAYQTTGGTWVESSITPSSLSATFSDVDGKIQIWVASGATIKAQSPYLQLEQGSIATAYEPYKSSSVTIQLGQTVYGARINFKTGEGIVDRVGVDLGALDWEYTSSIDRFSAPLTGVKNVSDWNAIYVIDSYYSVNAVTGNSPIDKIIGIYGTNVYVHDTAYNDASVLATALNGETLVYELATPITIQLTPSMLKLLEGYNYITADGDMSMVYIPESVLEEAQANAKAYTDNKVPDAPTTDGTYRLTCTVTDGVPTFSWESAT